VTDVAGPGFTRRCRAVGATPGTVLLGAAALACVESSDRPVVLPTMLANRDKHFADSVGLFVRTVLLREEPFGARTVGEARRGVLRRLVDCWRHRHESLLHAAERYPDIGLGSGPLPFFAQVLDLPPRSLPLTGCRTEQVYHFFQRTTRFGMELHLTPRADGGIGAAFVYDRARVRRPDVTGAIARYRHWLAVLLDPALDDSPLDRQAQQPAPHR
jgi:hypothetical protein